MVLCPLPIRILREREGSRGKERRWGGEEERTCEEDKRAFYSGIEGMRGRDMGRGKREHVRKRGHSTVV